MFPLSNYRHREAPPTPHHPRAGHLRSPFALRANEATLEGAYANDHYYDPPGDALAGFCSLCRCLFCPTWCALRDTVGVMACITCEVGSAIWEGLPALTLWTSYQARRNNGRITPYIPPPWSEPYTPSHSSPPHSTLAPSTPSHSTLAPRSPSCSSLQLKNGDGITSPFQVSPRYEVNYRQEGFVTKDLVQLSPLPRAARPPSRVPSPFTGEVWRRRGRWRPRPPKTPYPYPPPSPVVTVDLTAAEGREKW